MPFSQRAESNKVPLSMAVENGKLKQRVFSRNMHRRTVRMKLDKNTVEEVKREE